MNTHFHGGAEPYVSNTAHLVMKKWREIAGDLPTVLMGDFNLDPISETHQLFCGETGAEDVRGNFIDCWQALDKSENDAATSHSFEGGTSQHRIDWILVTPAFKPKQIDIIYYQENGRYPSDHYPVLAEIQYP
jgi:endonuclease/exonuclease/phosphatase family metal-dependent hydrolase